MSGFSALELLNRILYVQCLSYRMVKLENFHALCLIILFFCFNLALLQNQLLFTNNASFYADTFLKTFLLNLIIIKIYKFAYWNHYDNVLRHTIFHFPISQE